MRIVCVLECVLKKEVAKTQLFCFASGFSRCVCECVRIAVVFKLNFKLLNYGD